MSAGSMRPPGARLRRGILLAVILVVATERAGAQAETGAEPARGGETASALERRGLDLLLGRGGVQVDPERAAGLLEQAARAGRPVAAAYLGEQYWTGNGVAPDRARSLELLQGAAEQGVAAAQGFLGWMHLSGNAPEADLETARSWLTAAARQQGSSSMYLLADIYLRGIGTEPDETLGRELLTRAAELNFVPAMGWLGLRLLHDAERRDTEAGVLLLERAAAHEAMAGYNLGWEYLTGDEIERDLERARQWLARAAESEHSLAALWLAELYEKGLGVEPDASRAEVLRARALEVASMNDKNAFAWELSVRADPVLRNGPLAVRIMERALEAPEAATPARLDTLAAAYAEARRFEAAVAAQQRALAALPSDATEASKAVYRERLALYRAGEAYRRPR